MAAEPTSTPKRQKDDGLDVGILTPEESWRLFDADARHLLGISGEEFIRRWEAGEIVHKDDDSRLTSLIMEIPASRSGRQPG